MGQNVNTETLSMSAPNYYVFIDDEQEARRRIQKHIPVKKPAQIKKIKEIPARMFHTQNIPFGWCGTQGEND